MESQYIKSGINTLGDISWGTHVCQFYHTKDDLTDILVPYFRAGLENNEFCMWLTSEPLGVKEAKASLRKAVRHLGDYISRGQIEIIDYSKWYTKSGKFNADKELRGWIEKEAQALEKGFSGVRLTGNTNWLQAEDWVAFREYEEVMDSIISKHRMVAICSYSLDGCEASEVLDAMSNHETTIVKRNGLWRTIESDDRNKLNKLLISSETRFRRLFEASQDGILILDADTGQIMEANPYIRDLLGYTNKELLSKRLWELGLRRDKVKSEDTFKRLQEEKYVKYEDLQLETKGGIPVDVEFVSNVYEVDQRQIIQCNIRDISTRRKAEQASQLHKDHLEELVKQRTCELEESNIRLQQELSERKQAQERENQLLLELNSISRLAAIGEMAAGVAHEINNPLAGVVGFSELLLRKKIPKNLRDNISIIHDGACRIADVTDRMLKFARQSKPERTQVDLNHIAGTSLAIRAYAMKSGSINVITQLDRDLPLTYADAGLLQQVFLNIILNAEQAMKSAHNRGNLTVKTEKINNAIRISFKDDGKGIAKENLSKIFNPFFTTKEVGQGTGLGLSLCYGIVKQHDGKIYAKSRLGKGSTFFVELPIVTQNKQLQFTESAANKSERASRAKARILVVDDEPLVHKFLKEVLTEEKHDVEIVDDGINAIERLTSKKYDVILLDIKLPGKSGIEIYRELNKSFRSITKNIIFITGDVMEQTTMSFLSRIKPAYITKPFDTVRLLNEIDNTLSQQS